MSVPPILALVDAEEEPVVREASRILACDVSIVRSRSDFESRARGDCVLVVGDDQAPAERVSTVRRARKRHPDAVIAALAEDMEMKVAHLEAGASFVVGSADPPSRLAGGIRDAREGKCPLRPVEAEAVVRRLQQLAQLCVDQGVDVNRCDQLTAREREIVALLARHRSNAEIADSLGISVGTVKTHVHNILDKLDVEHRGLAGVYWRVFDEKRGLRR